MKPTIQDVAKLANVSAGSVSRYLNGYQLKPDNMKKIADAIKKLEYKENFAAKSLKRNKSFSIGILLNKQNYFSEAMVAKIEQELGKYGYGILITGFKNEEDLFQKKLEFLLSRQIDGLIIFEVPSEWEAIEALKTMTIPVISINNPIGYPNVCNIISDNYQSTASIIRELSVNGHHHIGIISAPEEYYVAQERLRGALDTVKTLKQLKSHVVYGDYSKASGYDGAKKLLENHDISALFVTNYNMSLGALQFIAEKKLIIGKDLAFVGYDYYGIRDLYNPKLSMVIPPVAETGEWATKLILQQLSLLESENLPKTIELKNKVLIGDSIKRNEKE